MLIVLSITGFVFAGETYTNSNTNSTYLTNSVRVIKEPYRYHKPIKPKPLYKSVLICSKKGCRVVKVYDR